MQDWMRRLVLVALGLLAIITLIGGYLLDWHWTGFGAVQGSGPAPSQMAKTLWDWLELLIVPAVLAIAALLFNRSIQLQQQRIATEERYEGMRQRFFQQMLTLLLDHNLLETAQHAQEAQAMAQALTASVLDSLDSQRRVSIVRFLRNAGVIQVDDPLVSLSNTDFTGADFRHVNLSQVQLAHMNLSGANFHLATLLGCNLSGSALCNANLRKAILYRAQMIGSSFQGAILQEADLAVIEASGASFEAADLTGATLTGAKLIGTRFLNADLERADLSNTDLTGADFTGANLGGTIFDGAYMYGTILAEDQLSGIDLSRAIFMHPQES